MTTTSTGPSEFTISQIASMLKVSVYRINYVLERHKDIEPVGRHGLRRLYGKRAVAAIRREIDRIDSRRSGAVVSPASQPQPA